MKSDNVKMGMQQAPHRSLFNALGFTEEEMKRAIGLYVSAKSAALNNVQTTLTRILGMLDGRVTLLVNKNEGITPQVLSIVEKCLRDITDMAKEGLICDEE